MVPGDFFLPLVLCVLVICSSLANHISMETRSRAGMTYVHSRKRLFTARSVRGAISSALVVAPNKCAPPPE